MIRPGEEPDESHRAPAERRRENCCTACIRILKSLLSLLSFSCLAILVFAIAWDNLVNRVQPCHGRFNPNINHLNTIIADRLHGQPLVYSLVINSVSEHLDRAPKKALVLSFHGPPGVGKNYITGMIAEALFEGGLGSPYVHHYSATNDFPHKDDEHIMQYKDRLLKEVPEKVKTCPYYMFIFDEMDKMPQNVIDTIKPFVEENPHRDGVDYRKATFLFLSNTAAGPIIDKTLELRRRGIDRTLFDLKDFDQIIRNHALAEQGGGLWQAELLTHHLIDHVVPFLPLEREHVELCVIDDLLERGRKNDIKSSKLRLISDELNYKPKGELIQYSEFGCRPVRVKVNMHMGPQETAQNLDNAFLRRTQNSQRDPGRDLLIILDESGSITDDVFVRAKERLANLLGYICPGIGPSYSYHQVAFMTFDESYREHFDFDDYGTYTGVRDAILQVPYTGHRTATSLALNYARTTMFSNGNFLTSTKGLRTDSLKEVLLITDGHPNEAGGIPAAETAAKNLRNVGVTVFALGIGNINEDHLKQLVSQPAHRHIFHLDKFADFHTMVDAVEAKYKGDNPCVNLNR